MKKALGVTLVALLALAACSSTKKSSSGGASSTSSSGTSATAAPSSSGGSTPGVTATEIRLGSIDYKAFYGDAIQGAMARAKRTNDAGGVFGRKIVIDNVLDDNQDNTTDVNDARTLVQQDHEFALLPVMTAAFEAGTYLESQHVPFFGWSIDPTWCNLAYGFGFEGNDCEPTANPLAADLGPALAKLFPDGTVKGKTVAIETEDNQSASTEVKSFSAGWVHDGATVVLTDSSMPSPPAVTGDYTPFAQRIMTANHGKPADAVEMVMSVSDTIGLYKKLVQLGYKGLIQDFTLYDPRIAPSTPGLVTEVEITPYEEAAQVASVQKMIADFNAYQPNMLHSQTVAAGYWSMDLFIAMLEKVGPNLTRDSFMKVANGNFSYDYGGGADPVSFPKDHNTVAPCFAFVKSNGTGFTVPAPFACYSTYPSPIYKKP